MWKRTDTDFLSTITATSEQGWGLLLGVLRHGPWAFEAVKRGEWRRADWRGHQLFGKTLGILGFGRLGRITATIGAGFQMRILAHDIRDFVPPPGIVLAIGCSSACPRLRLLAPSRLCAR